jgi:hypothetical protein
VTPRQQHRHGDGIVRCRVGDVVRHGRAIRIDQHVDGPAVVAAVRDGTTDDEIAVDTPQPDPVYDHVGYLHSEMGLRTRSALAKAERSRGQTTPYDEQLAQARKRRESLSADTGEKTLQARRQAVAAQTRQTEQRRERVATLRGKLQAAREHGEESAAVAQELEAAIRELSEIETAVEAARQQLETARQAARQRRDERERIRRLDDQIENLQRRARAHLVEEATDRYAEAVAAAPGSDDPADPFEAAPVTAGLAIARIASLSAPLVLGCDRFESVTAASEWLDAPVLKI